MTKFAELSRLPKNGEPCEMVKAYYEHILQLGTLATFLEEDGEASVFGVSFRFVLCWPS